MTALLLLGLFLMRESRRNPAARFDEAFADWVAANTARTVPQARLTLVETNSESTQGAPNAVHPWPWPPLEFALFIQAALQFNPDVIAIEPVLDWSGAQRGGKPLEKLRQHQKILHNTILRAPKIVLGAQLGFPDDPDIAPPLQPAPMLRNVKGDVSAIPQFTLIEQQAGEDLRLSAAVGFTNVLSRGEVAREAPLLFNYRGQIVPSLALQALIQWFKLTPDDVVVEPGAHIVLGRAATVPIDSAGRMNVDFNSPFARLGHDDLLLAAEQKQYKETAALSAGAMKGGIVLLARTDKASRTLLFPTNRNGSSGELCAAAIATVQNRAFIRRAPVAFDLFVIALMLLPGWFYARWSKQMFLILSFAALIGYLFVCMSAYALALVRLPIVLPTGLLFLANFFSLLSPRTES